jgi:hypothetical protein
VERLLAFDERAGAVRDLPEFIADPLHNENTFYLGGISTSHCHM